MLVNLSFGVHVQYEQADDVGAEEELTDQPHGGQDFLILDISDQGVHADHAAQKQGHGVHQHQEKHQGKCHNDRNPQSQPQRKDQDVGRDMDGLQDQRGLQQRAGILPAGDCHKQNIAHKSQPQAHQTGDPQRLEYRITAAEHTSDQQADGVGEQGGGK